MENGEMTFEKLPQAIGYLIEKVEALERSIQLKPEQKVEPADRWLNIDELREYLPDHPAKSTIYGWVFKREIPHQKGGKRLRFRQSEIDAWILLGKRKSDMELHVEAANYLSKKTRKN